MMKKRALLLVLLTLVAAGLLRSGETYSWFVYVGDTDVPVTAGRVTYFPDQQGSADYGGFIPDTEDEDGDSYVYPGRQLIRTKTDGVSLDVLRLNNLSDITTNVRVRFTATIVTDYGTAAAATRAAVYIAGSESDVWTLGLRDAAGTDTERYIPLLKLKYENTGAGLSGYGWEMAGTPLLESTAEQGRAEWELVMAGQTADDAFVPAAEAGAGGDWYNSLVSLEVTPELPTLEEETAFTNLYSGSRLLITIEYLARQHDAMDWTVFYTDTLTL